MPRPGLLTEEMVLDAAGVGSLDKVRKLSIRGQSLVDVSVLRLWCVWG